uniref:Pentraxin family member n=1 Tax=Pogona vitticeps TaxID=103695 RepID=A0A6J0SCG5_9SAUR
METMLGNLFLILASLAGALAETGLDEKVFVFPRPSDTDYVLLKPSLEAPLQHFTVCLSFFTDLERSFSLFSAASPQHDNEILVYFIAPNKYEVCVGGSCIAFRVPKITEETSSRWETACATWESTTGIVQLWINGQPLPRKGVARGHSIPANLVVMIGQEQDSFGGSLDAGQSFVGEIAEVYMWDTVVPPEQLRRIRRDTMPKPLVDWTALKYEIKGYVVIEPTLQ